MAHGTGQGWRMSRVTLIVICAVLLLVVMGVLMLGVFPPHPRTEQVQHDAAERPLRALLRYGDGIGCRAVAWLIVARPLRERLSW